MQIREKATYCRPYLCGRYLRVQGAHRKHRAVHKSATEGFNYRFVRAVRHYRAMNIYEVVRERNYCVKAVEYFLCFLKAMNGLKEKLAQG